MENLWRFFVEQEDDFVSGYAHHFPEVNGISIN